MEMKRYPVSSVYQKNTLLNKNQYQEMYAESVTDPQKFWANMAKELITWSVPFEEVMSGEFKTGEVDWFKGGKLNASYNCIDKHLKTRGDKIAIIFESDDALVSRKISFKELHVQVCLFANALKKMGITKGDRVCIYLPMIPEMVVAMLACARIGAIHSVVFAGFSAESLKVRILDASCKLLITADESMRGGKKIPLKENVDAALKNCPDVETVIVIKRTGKNIPWNVEKDRWFDDLIAKEGSECAPIEMDAIDPLFILYTSGSTGKPKGILHSTGGYLVYSATTFKYIFDYKDDEIYWCTADCGWITGHSYLVYGPLCNGATIVLYEGVPQYPDHSRYWQIIDKYRVNIFYTSPTAIRALRKEGDKWLTSTSRGSLRLLGTVGEPINPDVWDWYYKKIGLENCPIMDTWWQTETGGILISPLPGATDLKPGSAGWPFLGIVPAIVDENGKTIENNLPGRLVILKPWPGMMKSIYKDKERFFKTYFSEVPNAYLTGDGAQKDGEGYFWISGRNDDVIKVSGHRIGTEEVESALLTHHDVSEAAVVAIANEIKGQAIYAFVTINSDVNPTDELKKNLKQAVREHIGAIAVPEKIQWAKALPKTRSGKIMRRILRKIANNEMDDLGDLSTLIDPTVIDALVGEREVLSVK